MIQTKEFKRLIAFKAVYESSSFSKAANTLFLTQSAISSQIQQLEEELQVTLFDRKGRNAITPTEAGRIFYDQVREILEVWHNAMQKLSDQSEYRKKCTIAASNSFSISFMPSLIEYLAEQHPNIEFNVIESNSDSIYNMVLHREYDFGFVERALPKNSKITQMQVLKDPLVLGGDPESKLWLTRENHSAMNHFNYIYLQENGIIPENIMIANTNDFIIRMLESGQGRSLVSKRNLKGHDFPYEEIDSRYERDFHLLIPNPATTVYEDVWASIEKWCSEIRNEALGANVINSDKQNTEVDLF